jgi:hypothetical protein
MQISKKAETILDDEDVGANEAMAEQWGIL